MAGPWEIGSWKDGGQGARSDSTRAVAILRAGGLKRLLDEQPEYVLKYPKQCKEFLAIEGALHMGIREVTVIWIDGPTDIGKSHHAFHMGVNTGLSMYPFPLSDKTIWFDGYCGEDILIIDELNTQMIPEPMMLRIMDKWPLQCPIKGSMCKANWMIVVITSNHPPTSIYPELPGPLAGRMARRIHFHVHAETRDELSTKMEQLLVDVQARYKGMLGDKPGPNTTGVEVTGDEVAGNTGVSSTPAATSPSGEPVPSLMRRNCILAALDAEEPSLSPDSYAAMAITSFSSPLFAAQFDNLDM